MLWLAVFGTLAFHIPNFVGCEEKVVLCLYGFRQVEGQLEGRDVDSDLAVATFSPVGGLMLNQRPFALGNPDIVRPYSYT